MLPGLCSVTFRDLSPSQIIDLAGSAGVKGIEWGADVHVPSGDIDRAASVEAATSAAGIACPSYGTYLGVRAPITDAATVVEHCRTAAALGSTNLRVWAQLGVDPTAAPHDRAAIADGIRLAGDIAGEHGMTIGVEFHHGTLTETASSALQLLAEVDRPNVFSYWQPDFWAEHPHDVDGQIAEMRAMRPHLSHLHVFWWLAKGERQPLVDGAAMWPSVLGESALLSNGWTGPRYAFLEFVAGDEPAQFRNDAATLVGWLAA